MRTNITGQIVFYYPHTALFDDVQHQSAFMCKNIVSKEGEDLSERYAITGDEKGMFDICLREAMPDIYDAIKGITYGIENAIDESMTGAALKQIASSLSVDDNALFVVICVQDNGAYNPNDPRISDNALQSAIEAGVLSEFYSRVTHPDLTKLSATEFVSSVKNVVDRTMPLRKKSTL